MHCHEPRPAAVLLDLKLALRCTGLRRLPLSLRREAVIKAQHPATPFSYLWFLGVDPLQQRAGLGSALLSRVLADSAALRRPVYLETSTTANAPFYEPAGFTRYHEAQLPFPVYYYRFLHD